VATIRLGKCRTTIGVGKRFKRRPYRIRAEVWPRQRWKSPIAHHFGLAPSVPSVPSVTFSTASTSAPSLFSLGPNTGNGCCDAPARLQLARADGTDGTDRPHATDWRGRASKC
jgi:hypothetical protein